MAIIYSVIAGQQGYVLGFESLLLRHLSYSSFNAIAGKRDAIFFLVPYFS